MIFMLIQVCDSVREMAQHIYNMRVYIRKEESDIRSNTKICTKLWKFVDSVMDEYGEDFESPAKAKTRKSKKNAREDDYRPSKPQKRARVSEK